MKKNQRSHELSGLRLPTTTASTRSAANMENAVATTLMTTSRCLPMPYLPTMGYDTRVWLL